LQNLFQEREKIYEPVMKNKKSRKEDDQEKNFSCNLCAKKYSEESSLLIHIKLKHSKLEVSEEKQPNRDNDIFIEDQSD
jgi:hypothetical protein